MFVYSILKVIEGPEMTLHTSVLSKTSNGMIYQQQYLVLSSETFDPLERNPLKATCAKAGEIWRFEVLPLKPWEIIDK